MDLNDQTITAEIVQELTVVKDSTKNTCQASFSLGKKNRGTTLIEGHGRRLRPKQVQSIS